MTVGDSTPVRHSMELRVGAESVTDATSGYTIDGFSPEAVVLPGNIHEMSQALAAACDGDMAVAPWGGGTRIDLGNRPSRVDAVIDLSRLDRVVQHNPADLTVTVEAGITLGSLQQTLEEHGQFLALDAPLPDRASIGGTLAVGQGGPLKWQYGSPRDLVIGMVVVQADGTVVKSGGQVVKNVSGYDMARLHVGGLGTLGVIAEVSFKLTPLPTKETTLVAAFSSSYDCVDAGLGIFHSDVTPLALVSFDGPLNRRADAVNLDGSHFLAVRLGGRPLTLERQMRECSAICVGQGAATVETLDETDASTFWRRLTDFGWGQDSLPVIAARTSLEPARISELYDALAQASDGREFEQTLLSDHGYGTVLIRWFDDGDGASPDEVSKAVDRARDAVHTVGGRLIVERCPLEVKRRFDVWDDIDEPLAIMRRMKDQYDPKGVLNPGRFVGGI